MIELREDRAHAMETQTTSVAGTWNELAAEGVHLSKRTYLTSVAEVVSKLTTSEAWTRSRLYGDNLIVSLATKHLADEWGSKSAEVRTTTSTTYNHISLDAEFFQSCLYLKTNDGLVDEHLIEH